MATLTATVRYGEHTAAISFPAVECACDACGTTSLLITPPEGTGGADGPPCTKPGCGGRRWPTEPTTEET